MARLLSPTDYGQVGMITFFILLGDTIVDSGFGNALIRKNNQTKEDYNTVFCFNVITGICCYIILFFTSPFIAEFFNMPLLKWLLRVQAVCIILNALLAVQITRLTVDLNFKAIAKCNFTASILSGLTGIILAYCGFGVWALVCQTVVSSLITLIYLTIVFKWIPSFHISKESLKSLFSYGSKILASSVINRIYQNLTTLVIGKFYSAADLGLYDRGTALVGIPAEHINGVVEKITFPIMAKLQDEPERLLNVQRKYIKILSLSIFFCTILLAALAKPVINIILSEKWSGAVIFMQIYALSVCFKHLDVINLNLLYVKGRSDLVLKLEFIKKTISTLVLLASIPFGVVAICISRVIHSITTVICDSYYTGKFYNYGLGKQLVDIAPYFFASLAASFPAFLLTYTSLNQFLIVLLGGVTALLIYYIILRRNAAMVELLELISSIISRKKSVKSE